MSSLVPGLGATWNYCGEIGNWCKEELKREFRVFLSINDLFLLRGVLNLSHVLLTFEKNFPEIPFVRICFFFFLRRN